MVRFRQFAKTSGNGGRNTMNLTPLIDQPKGFQVSEWTQDEAKCLYEPLVWVLSGKPSDRMLD